MPDSTPANSLECVRTDKHLDGNEVQPKLGQPSPERQSSWSDIVTQWGHLARFCIAVFFVTALVVGSVAVIVGGFPGDLKIKAGETALVFYKDGREQAATLLLPATEEWLDTHINITSDRQITIGASGHINIAVHHAIEWAQHKDQELTVGLWAGPIGLPQYFRPVDDCRRPLLIAPDQPYGAVLGYVRSQGSPPPTPANPRPAGVFYIGDQKVLNNPKDGKMLAGELFLTINDAIVTSDPKAEEAYVCSGNALALKQSYKQKATVQTKRSEWKSLVKRKFWDALFQDNAGEFLIRIAFEKP
ncbi:MAG TPA: hypothetical protein VNW97_06325 [Candidatus Saccharimonadales bacterium]|jgi:hypothetical protein|nr:hypothetical protein [Candidatus Saccharimonadales bacterium]